MTAHIESSKDDIAKVVLMPGDPLRAKYSNFVLFIITSIGKHISNTIN